MSDIPNRLYLHVGHAKTGSSAIQSALANAASRLLEAGFCYPELSDGALDNARSNKTSSGNLGPNTSIARVLDARRRELAGRSVVFSSESLFVRIRRGELVDELQNLALPGGPHRVLLLVRDPIDWLQSSFQQQVKTRRFTGSLDDLAASSNHLALVRSFLVSLDDVDAEITVRNYSRCRDALDVVAADWLDVDPTMFSDVLEPRVNRSLTRSELELQRLFNVHSQGPTSRFVSVPLVNEIPDLSADRVAWSEDSLRTFYRKMEVEMAVTNELLPESEHYALPPLEEAIEMYCRLPTSDDEYRFTARQLDVLVAHIAARLDSPARAAAADSGASTAEFDRLVGVEADHSSPRSARTVRWVAALTRTCRRLRSVLVRSG